MSATKLKSRVGSSDPSEICPGAGGDLRHHGGDHRAGRLAGAVGVERPDRHHRQVEAQVVALGELVGRHLRRRVGRLGLQRVVLGDRHGAGGAVDLARGRVHDPRRAEGAGRFEHVERAPGVGVEVGRRRQVGVRDGDEGREVVHHVDVRQQRAHRPGVAHVARHDLDLVSHLVVDGVEPAPRAERVVLDQGTHAVALAHQRLDEVGADEPVGSGDGDVLGHGWDRPSGEGQEVMRRPPSGPRGAWWRRGRAAARRTRRARRARRARG